MKTKPYDEHYRRQHRIVGHYLALTAWTRDLDCILLDRDDVQILLNISNTGEDLVWCIIYGVLEMHFMKKDWKRNQNNKGKL